MEVRGSVIVRDISDQHSEYKKYSPQSEYNNLQCERLVDGAMMLHTNAETLLAMNPSAPNDGVPRISVSGFRKGVKLWKMFSVFNKFGTVTYIVIGDQFAVIEFDNIEVVNRILKLKVLKFEEASVKVEPLPHFIHAEPEQQEFTLQKETAAALVSVQCFHEYVDSLCRNSRLQSDPEAEHRVCLVLEKTLETIFPDCRAYPFGSRVSGTGLPQCDLDIFLDSGDMYFGNSEQDPDSQEHLVVSACKILGKHKDFRHVEAVPKARTPILRFLHLPTTTRCDVAFRHGLGIENTKLLKFLMKLEPRMHPLSVFIKQWAQIHEMRGTRHMGQFTSYALIMMLVYYLQQLPQPVLPPIATLQALHTGRKLVVAGWECSFTTDKSVVPATTNTQTVLDLLDGFFKLYRSFDYERLVICPLLGKAVEKTAYHGNMRTLQPAMSRYLLLLTTKQADKFRSKCPISIQDPFDLSHNVSRSVKTECLMAFISVCGLTQNLCAGLR